MATGIRKLHTQGCPAHDGGRCRCKAGWEASVYLKRERRKLRKTFAREAEAKSWRAEAATLAVRGALRAPRRTTVRQAWEDWYEGARSGAIRNRSGDAFKPSALRSYERAMRLRLLPALGATRLSEVTKPDVQRFTDRLLGEGLDPSTVRCSLLPLRAICNLAVSRGELAFNPCDGLRLPAVRGGRDRIADPQEAEALIAAVPERDRALWATAFYAGLRRGELQALRRGSIDLAAGVIRIERGWDDKEGEVAPKSAAGIRRVPIPAVLRDRLTEHAMSTERGPDELAFGRSATVPFYPKAVQDLADMAWRRASLQRITFHECRHTFASLMIAAGVNAKALSTYMGHANISITLDRYGHLMPGSEDEAAGLLDSYLEAQRERQEELARAADPVREPGPTGERAGEPLPARS